MALPTGHIAVGQTSLTTWRCNEPERYSRGPPQPIGWRLDEDKRVVWAEAVTQGADEWTPYWDATDINHFVKKLVNYTKRGSRRRSRASATEAALKYMLTTTHDDEARARLQQPLWQERRRKRREKSEAHLHAVLQDLKVRRMGQEGHNTAQGAHDTTQAERRYDDRR